MAEGLTFCDLSDELLCLVAAELSLEDLCNLGRVNKRLHKLLNEGEQLWRGLLESWFGAHAGPSTSKTPEICSAKEAFQSRYWEAVLDEAAADAHGHAYMDDWELEQEEDWGYGSDPEYSELSE